MYKYSYAKTPAPTTMICLGIHEAPMTENGDDSRVVNFPSFVFSNKGINNSIKITFQLG